MHIPEPIFYFFLAAAFSFIGSILPATGNVITIQISITKGTKAALVFAFGEVILEFFFGFIALKISDYINTIKGTDLYLRVIAIGIFLVLSVFYFFNKQKPKTEEIKNYKTNFAYGLLIGLLNPLAVPYWVFYFSYFYSSKWITENSPYEWYLVAGIPVGSFALLTVYALLGKKIATIFNLRIEYLNKSIAIIFFLIATIESIRLLVDL